ncbi:MAG TPA: phosphatase PAP2 family protein [Clostridiales bacterium]|jgi:undecaprenyl-diphosphatase|nr:phosphatase PAP2 family protein [Clostridiales bacterium]HBY33258.1 phosphatase PAP2 family protein [Clostridiales bacterium]
MPSRISKRELKVLDWMYEHLRCKAFDRVMPFLSLTGNFGIIWFAAAGTFYFANINQEAAVCILLALGCSLLFVNLILKRVTKRPRPYEARGEMRDIIIREPKDFSFPSGHTFSSFAAATTIARFSPRLGAAALIYAFGIAFSRLYLYVHYISDVLTSAIFGVATGLLVSYLYMNGFISF